ncbi:hypothetical protein SEVIR_4G218250v4 [Setaria viridis]
MNKKSERATEREWGRSRSLILAAVARSSASTYLGRRCLQPSSPPYPELEAATMKSTIGGSEPRERPCCACLLRRRGVHHWQQPFPLPLSPNFFSSVAQTAMSEFLGRVAAKR